MYANVCCIWCFFLLFLLLPLHDESSFIVVAENASQLMAVLDVACPRLSTSMLSMMALSSSTAALTRFMLVTSQWIPTSTGMR